MVEPEVRGEGVMGCCGEYAIFEDVARGEAEEADGFDADVLIDRCIHDGRIGLVGDGAGEDVGSAAAGMGDANERDFDLLKGAVVVEIEAGELADADFGIDFDDAVNFFARVAVTLEADFGFEESDLDLGRRFFCWRCGFGRFLRADGAEKREGDDQG